MLEAPEQRTLLTSLPRYQHRRLGQRHGDQWHVAVRPQSARFVRRSHQYHQFLPRNGPADDYPGVGPANNNQAGRHRGGHRLGDFRAAGGDQRRLGGCRRQRTGTLGSGSSGSSIQNLVINGFGGSGMEVDSTNDSVVGCYIGTNGAGTAAVPNTIYGIDVVKCRERRSAGPPRDRPMSFPETAAPACTSTSRAWWRETSSARIRRAPPLCPMALSALMSKRRERRSAEPPRDRPMSPGNGTTGILLDGSSPGGGE